MINLKKHRNVICYTLYYILQKLNLITFHFAYAYLYIYTYIIHTHTHIHARAHYTPCSYVSIVLGECFLHNINNFVDYTKPALHSGNIAQNLCGVTRYHRYLRVCIYIYTVRACTLYKRNHTLIKEE